MEISGIRSALPFLFQGAEKDTVRGLQETGDVVDLHAPELLTDEEAEVVLQDSIRMIGEDSAAALSVHTLSEQRVFALLGM